MNDVKPGTGGPTLVEEAQAFGIEVTRALIEKGYTPHTSEGPFGKSSSWEDHRSEPPNLWTVVVLLIAAMIFIVLMVQGVPWT